MPWVPRLSTWQAMRAASSFDIWLRGSCGLADESQSRRPLLPQFSDLTGHKSIKACAIAPTSGLEHPAHPFYKAWFSPKKSTNFTPICSSIGIFSLGPWPAGRELVHLYFKELQTRFAQWLRNSTGFRSKVEWTDISLSYVGAFDFIKRYLLRWVNPTRMLDFREAAQIGKLAFSKQWSIGLGEATDQGYRVPRRSTELLTMGYDTSKPCPMLRQQ